MKQTIYELDANALGNGYAKKIAELHIKAFPSFFLTQLGESFLTLLYRGYIEDKSSGIIVSEDEKGSLLGFIAYSRDYSGFFRGLIRQHILGFAFNAIIAAAKNPRFIKRLVGAFGKSDQVQRLEPYVELASIGVDPEKNGLGIGTSLIGYLIQIVDFNDFSYISLETDANDNERANQFYQKNGFTLSRVFVTAEGRRMNEYRYRKETVPITTM